MNNVLFPVQRKIDLNIFPKDPSKAVPGIFYHRIDLSNKFSRAAILQLSNPAGMIQSPEYMASWDDLAAASPSIRDIEIDDLKSGTAKLGLVTPTAGDFIGPARDIRNGGLKVSEGEKAVKLMKSDIELEFEEGRRTYAPEAVSRLNCLYVFDNRRNIEVMFGRECNRLVLRVKIAEALRFTKADFRWYHAYCKIRTSEEPRIAQMEDCIKNYWLSHPFEKESNTWECLVDGMIRLYDPKDIELIRRCKKKYFSN